MSKPARTLALMTALAVGTIAVSSAQVPKTVPVPAPAAPLAPNALQAQKDDKKKDDKKKDEKKVGTIEVYKAKDGGYRFRVKNADGKNMAISAVSADTKDEALKQLEDIKDTLNAAKPMDVKK